MCKKFTKVVKEGPTNSTPVNLLLSLTDVNNEKQSVCVCPENYPLIVYSNLSIIAL